MTTCLLGLGANLGDRAATLDRAVARLRALPRSRLAAVSRWHETLAVGGPSGQGAFLNGAARLETDLSADALLDQLHAIERELGRHRGARWGARTIDLDLLLHGDTRLTTPAVQVPHPRLTVRRFVLEPAGEVAADLVDPSSGWSIARLLEHLNTAPSYVAIASAPGPDRRQLAQALANAWQGRLVLDAGALTSESPSLDPMPGEAAARTLQSRAASLDRATWPETCAARRAGGPVAVSEFWLGESLWAARRTVPPLGVDTPSIASGCVSPLLIVAYDLGAPAAAASTSERPADAWTGALREELLRGGHGPVLWFDRRPHDEVLADVTAAIAGMR